MGRLLLVGLMAAAIPVATLAAQDAALVEKGQKVYAAAKPACMTCHSIAGKGNKKGPLDEVGSKLTADEIRQWLVAAEEMTAKSKASRKPVMKSYTKLPKEDLDALVAYLHSLKKK